MKFSVIFDMDGLMLDTERVEFAGCKLAARELGYYVTDETLLSMVGTTWAGTEKILRDSIGPTLDFSRLRTLWHQKVEELFNRDGIGIKTGLLPLLDLLELHDVRKAVATSTRRQQTEQRLRMAGILERFDAIVAGDDIERGKPEPDIYLKAAAYLKVDPSQCFALEDSGPGLQSAYAAGMTPVLIPDLVRPHDDIARLARHEFASLIEAGEHFAGLLRN